MMILTPARVTKQAIDDYLDLLNYAKKIGDLDWQANLLHMLHKLNESPEHSMYGPLQNHLWNQFDEINSEILDLFIEIRRSQDDTHKRHLLEKLWELKLVRIEISQKIKALTI